MSVTEDRMIEDVATLVRLPAARAALARYHDRLEAIVEQTIAVQQIAAPTFAESDRAAYIEERFGALGLQDVERDEMDNVFGRVPGSLPGAPVVVSAHIDTVFCRRARPTINQSDGRVAGRHRR